MDEIKTVLESTKELAPKQRRDALREFMNRRDIGSMFILLNGENRRTVLRALSDMAAAPVAGEIIGHYMDIHHERISTILRDEDAKTRKNCAELIGKLRAEAFSKELLAAFAAETSFFVLPSLILALGNSKQNEAYQTLKAYVLPECEKKHAEAIEAARRKALVSLRPVRADAKIGILPEGTALVLDCPSKDVTRRELTALKIENKNCPFLMNAAMAYGISEYREIFRAKTFYTAAIYLGTAKNGYDLPTKPLRDMMIALFGEEEIPYRIELTADEPLSGADRRDKTARFAMEMDKDGIFINSPSSYVCTVHIHTNAKGSHVMIEPAPALDPRFAYRKHVISASAHPATAAACVFFIRRYLSPNAKVLDCFCGSGTMLFARARFPFGSLTGTDISAEALKAARANERLAKTGAHFLIKNAITPFAEEFDEVICNMPFGIRVSNHEKNRFLYRDFLKNLPSILSENGMAFLFTQEKELLKHLLAEQEGLELIDKHTFNAGGLYPSLYVIRKKA